MTERFHIYFGGAIAAILLALYASLVWVLIFQAITKDPTSATAASSNDSLTYVVTTIGGLISALVISSLAITRPGDEPRILKMMSPVDEGKGSPTSLRKLPWATILTMVYLVVWMLVGLASLVVGVIWKPDADQTLSDLGTTWLGLAVAAGYSYFGINPAPE